MALFDYSGFNSSGKTVKGTIEASGKKSALDQLREKGIYASLLDEQQQTASRPVSFFRRARRIPIRDLASATRLLATLLQAGVSLDEALLSLTRQSAKPEHGRLFQSLRESVRQGHSLYQALRTQGRCFPELYCQMIQVGESSGSLDQVLLQLASFLEEQDHLRSRTLTALVYPLLMALVGSGVLLFLITFVVPKITRMLTDLGQTLPLPTRLLIGTSHFLAEYGWMMAALFIAILVMTQRYYTRPHGRLLLDSWKLRLPVVGSLILAIATARFSRTLGTLLGSGIPLLKALDISNGLLGNRQLQQAIEQTATAVREGASLADPLQRSGLFPALLSQMTAVGERSGQLEQMLLKVADYQDRQIDTALSTLLALLEPLMILVMGTVIGFIVLAVLLPIFQASQGIG